MPSCSVIGVVKDMLARYGLVAWGVVLLMSLMRSNISDPAPDANANSLEARQGWQQRLCR